MESEGREEAQDGQVRRRRSRRPFYRRRRFWILLLATLAAIVLTVWLIRTFESYKPTDDF